MSKFFGNNWEDIYSLLVTVGKEIAKVKKAVEGIEWQMPGLPNLPGIVPGAIEGTVDITDDAEMFFGTSSHHYVTEYAESEKPPGPTPEGVFPAFIRDSNNNGVADITEFLVGMSQWYHDSASYEPNDIDWTELDAAWSDLVRAWIEVSRWGNRGGRK